MGDTQYPCLYSKWIRTDYRLPPEDSLVQTKIDDYDGIRNQQPLRFRRGLWWIRGENVYVYYIPTHWRPFEEGEL